MKPCKKLTRNFQNIKFAFICVTIISILGSCHDDTADILPFYKEPGNGEFYRLTALGDVDVIPENRQVRVLVRVTDSLNFGVAELDKADFEVLENNTDKVGDVEANTKIDPERIPYTIKTVLLLDISSSVEGKVKEIKSAVKDLILSKVNSQEFAIYTFDSKVKKLLDFTENTNELLNVVESIPESGLDNSTNLYQAIINASKTWVDKIGISEIEEGSMIVFTDGKHNADPGLNRDHVLQALGAKSLYIAGLESPNLDEENLKYIAGDESRYFLANNIDGLASVFEDIQDKILTQSRSIYYITYTTPISVPGRQNLKILIKDNSNPGNDCFVETFFNTHQF